MCLKILISIFAIVNSLGDGARILGIFQTPSLSHQVVFRTLMHELAKRGHQVTVMTPDPAFEKGKAPENLTEIDVHDISYDHWLEFVNEVALESADQIKLFKKITPKMYELYEKQFAIPEMQAILKGEEKFELLFIESGSKEVFEIAKREKIPVIEMLSLPALDIVYEMHGAATHPIIYPSWLQSRLKILSTWDKIRAIKKEVELRDIIISSFAMNSVELSDFLVVEMLFVNAFPIWDHNRAVPPNVIYLGGMHQKPEKDLPADLKFFLDSSNSGVIYMSFGTNVDPTVLSREKIQVFCQVFSRLPYDVLWKWNGDELYCKPHNVKISKWLPQSDLLRHPKIKAFITQAGLQSTDESITAGVPLIAFPMLGDQWYNAEMYVKHKLGLKMNFDTVTEESLMSAIETVINDKSFRKNIKKFRDVVNDQPQSPLERAVWWTEYVLRHGGAKHLRSPMANISWSEYLMLDVVAALFFALAISLILLFLSCQWIIKIVFKTSKLKSS